MFDSLLTHFLSCVASFESIARRPLSLGPCHAPIFLEENVAVRFVLRKLPSNLTIRELSVFRKSLISKLLIRRPKTALVPRLCPCPVPFGKERSTRLRVPLSEKYQVYQSEGGVFRSSSAYEKSVSVLCPFLLREVNCTE